MLNFYKILLTFFNVVLFFIGISYILMSKDMEDSQAAKERPCPHENSTIVLWMGASVLVMTSIGILMAFVPSRHLVLCYKWAITGAAAAFIMFFTFFTVLFPKANADVVFLVGSNSHWMTVFNPLLPMVMTNSFTWHLNKECYIASNVCFDMRMQSNDQKDYMVEAGCCMPPNRCNMTQVGITAWEPGPVQLKDDEECRIWKEPGMESCFDCPSCKAAYINSFKTYWDNTIGVQLLRLSTLVLMAGLTWIAFWEGPADGRNSQNNQARLAKSYLNP